MPQNENSIPASKSYQQKLRNIYRYINTEASSAYSSREKISTKMCNGQRSSSSRNIEMITAVVDLYMGNTKSR